MKPCPHCGQPVFRKSTSGSKLKVATRVLVIHKSGEVEINCPSCRKGVLIPLVRSEGEGELRKADTPKLVARKA